MYLLQNSVFGDYHVVKNNCEDFALYCKTGLLIRCNPTPTTGSSGQVNFWSNVSWKSIVYSAAEKVVRTTMPYVTVTVEIGVHSWKKYKTDIGVRDDVEKVKVEEVASFREVVNHG
uniref:protein LEAD-SENSITIVE 1-like n=1 Tax=Erigeron canadensis TaxID=72917 RepID=UPI001CB96AF7|nr:protein LEAD-SENSITIVE 1-like [Erigeron canadensis]